MLEDVISKRPVQEKLARLEREHGFKVDVDVERGVKDMGNWSDAIEERTVKRKVRDVVINMLKRKMPYSDIAEIVTITIDEVIAIADKEGLAY